MRRSTRRALAVVLGATAGLCAAEMIARRQLANDLWLHRPAQLDITFRPDPQRMPGVDGPSRYRTNSMGLRGAELGGSQRVLAVGGSTTACEYLDQDEAWPELLRRLCGDDAGERPWVGNAGGSGLALVDHLLQVQRLGAQIEELDVVVVLVGVNDLAQAIEHRGDVPPPADPLGRAFFDRPRTHAWLPPSKTALAHVLRRLRKRRWAAGAAEDALGDSYDQRRAARVQGEPFVDVPRAQLDGALAIYRDRLAVLARRIRGLGAEPLFLTQPVLWREDLPADDRALLWYGWLGRPPWEDPDGYVTIGTLAQGMRAYNDVLRAVCAELDVMLVDLAAELPRTRAMFYDDCHLNEDGARRVAALVAPALTKLLAR